MEQSASFQAREYIGKPIELLKEQKKYFQKPGFDESKRPTMKECEWSYIEAKTGNPKGIFHNCKEKGISAFTPEGSNIIEFITLYNQSIDKFSIYPYEIPYKITLDMKNSDVVKRFGDSKEKGGGSIPIWVNYENFGIQFTFQSKDWNEIANPITHITIYQPKKQEDCALCLKELKKQDRDGGLIGCSKCEVLFCSIYCWEQFKAIHICVK